MPPLSLKAQSPIDHDGLAGDVGRFLAAKYTTSPTKLCKVGDLILCVRGSTTGRMNIAGFDGSIGRGVAAIRSDKYQNWINQYIDISRDKIYSLGSGSTFPNVTADTLINFDIYLPPLEAQKQIVDRIEAERTLVDSAKKLIELYEQKTKKVIAKLWH